MAKNAIIALKEMCQQLREAVNSEVEVAIIKLLKRGSDTNVFIAEEARCALEVVCSHCSEAKVVETLLGLFTTKASSAKANICRCLMTLSKGLGSRLLEVPEYEKLVISIANYMLDSSQDVRVTAKQAIATVIISSLSCSELHKLLYQVRMPLDSVSKITAILEKDLVNPASASAFLTKSNSRTIHAQL